MPIDQPAGFLLPMVWVFLSVQLLESAAHAAPQRVSKEGELAAQSDGDSAKAIRAKIGRLTERNLSKADKALAKVQRLLDKGDIAGARATSEAARSRLRGVQRATEWSNDLSANDAPYLSMVKVRIERIRSVVDKYVENAPPLARAQARAHFLFSKDAAVTARITATCVVGRAFFRRSLLARRYPDRMRDDLGVGRSVELRVSSPKNIGADLKRFRVRFRLNPLKHIGAELKVGGDYWIIIWPPNIGPVQGMLGNYHGPSGVVLAIPVR